SSSNGMPMAPACTDWCLAHGPTLVPMGWYHLHGRGAAKKGQLSRGLQAAAQSSPSLDHDKVVRGKQRLVGQRRELDLTARTATVAVVGQRTGRPVIDDAVVGIERLGAETEEVRIEPAGMERRE